MCFFAWSQNNVYDSKGNKIPFRSEEIDITFSNSGIKFPDKEGPELAPALLAILPTIVDVGFKLTSSALEKSVKKYSAEYSKQKSNLGAGSKEIPNFKFTRLIKLDNSSAEITALEITINAQQVESLQGFVYYIKNVELLYSSAKSTSSQNTFDYSLELKPTFLIEGEKKVQELSPITISSLEFTNNQFSLAKHRSDIIPMPPGAVLTEISVKIVESNPYKVRAEKILSLWNDNKDSGKTIVNNFLPKEKEDPNTNSGKEGNKSRSTGTGNRP